MNNCNCTATTENKKNTLKVRKGNTLKLKLKYTINGTPASIESFNKTSFYLINPYQIKREITNYNVPRRFDDEVEISLTEDVIGRYSIEMVYRDDNNTQATYDFEDVFEIVGKSSEETDITDSEFINKEVSLNGYLRLGYDDEALDRRIGDLPNFAMMRGTMFILNNEVEKIKEQLSRGGNGTSECDCEQIRRDITSIQNDIHRLQDKVTFFEQLHSILEGTLSDMNASISGLHDKVRVAPTNKDLQELIRRVTVLENRPATPTTTQPPTTTPTPPSTTPQPPTTTPTPQPPTTTPTPPNNDGGNDRYNIPVDNPFEPVEGEYIPDWVERVDEFETNGDEEI